MKNLYTIQYHGKTYRRRGETAIEAIDKLSNHMVFGDHYLIPHLESWTISADDYGISWAEAWVPSEWTRDGERRVFAEIVEDEIVEEKEDENDGR